MRYQKFACALLAVGILLTTAGCNSETAEKATKKVAAAASLSTEVSTEKAPAPATAEEKSAVEVKTTVEKATAAPAAASKTDPQKSDPKKVYFGDIKINNPVVKTVYLKTAKCSVVLPYDADAVYTADMHYVTVGEYVFVFGSSNVFKAICNNNTISVPEAYEKGYLAKDDLKKLYDNFPKDWKMPLMQYLLAEKSTGERREFKTATEKNPNGTVLVTLSTAVSKKYQLTPADFAALGVNNIAKVTSYTWPNEANEQLSLTLKEPGVDKVNQLIEQLSGLSGVVSARPDTYIYLD